MSTRRIVFWNLGLIGTEAGLLIWTHSLGVSWLALALLVAGLLFTGAAAFVYLDRVHLPLSRRGVAKYCTS